MSVIPTGHDAAAVFVGRYMTNSGRSDKRAFSCAARARRWVESKLDRELEWGMDVENGMWIASESHVRARVERIPMHDPSTLQRRYPDAFGGNYTNSGE